MNTTYRYHIIYLTILTWLFCLSLNAQTQFAIGDVENAVTINSRPLAVVRRTPDEKVLNKLAKKPEELKEYEKLFEDYNRILEETIKREWRLSSVSFISEVEAEHLKAEKNDKFCLLVTAEVRAHNVSRTGPGVDYANMFKPEPPVYDLDSDFGVPVLQIVLASKPKNILAWTTISSSVKLGPPVLTWSVQQLINQVQNGRQNLIVSYKDFDRAVSIRTPELKNKTLLLCEDVLLEEFKAAIQKGRITKDDYPYSFELVSYERLSEVISNHDEKYAYVWKVPTLYHDSGRRSHDTYVVDAKDGSILWFTTRHAFPLFDYGHFESINKDLH